MSLPNPFVVVSEHVNTSVSSDYFVLAAGHNTLPRDKLRTQRQTAIQKDRDAQAHARHKYEVEDDVPFEDKAKDEETEEEEYKNNSRDDQDKTFCPGADDVAELLRLVRSIMEQCPRPNASTSELDNVVFTQRHAFRISRCLQKSLSHLLKRSVQEKQQHHNNDIDDYLWMWQRLDYIERARRQCKLLYQGLKFYDQEDYKKFEENVVQSAGLVNLIFTGHTKKNKNIVCACLLHLDVMTCDRCTALIENFCAFPTGAGRGSILLQEVIKFCQEHPIIKQIVCCLYEDDDGGATRRFYEKHGFKQQALSENEGPPEEAHLTRMVLYLDR